MQRFDFTKTGGFPLSQDRLAWMQEGYIDSIDAVASVTSSTEPVALTGVEINSLTGALTDGWMWYPDEGVVPFVGSQLTVLNDFVVVTDIKTPLTFKNNSQQLVQINRVAKLSAGGTYKASTMKRYWQAFQAQGREQSWTAVPVSGSAVNGSLAYKKDDVAGIMKIRAGLVVSGGVGIPYSHQIWTPDAAHMPYQVQYFKGFVKYQNNAYPIATNGEEIRDVNFYIEPSGGLGMIMEVRPAAAAYIVQVSVVITMD